MKSTKLVQAAKARFSGDSRKENLVPNEGFGAGSVVASVVLQENRADVEINNPDRVANLVASRIRKEKMSGTYNSMRIGEIDRELSSVDPALREQMKKEVAKVEGFYSVRGAISDHAKEYVDAEGENIAFERAKQEAIAAVAKLREMGVTQDFHYELK